MCTFEEFVEIIEDSFPNIKPGTLHRSTNLKATIEWDSLNAVLLTTTVLCNFNIKLEYNDIKDLTTVEELYEQVKKRVNIMYN